MGKFQYEKEAKESKNDSLTEKWVGWTQSGVGL